MKQHSISQPQIIKIFIKFIIIIGIVLGVNFTVSASRNMPEHNINLPSTPYHNRIDYSNYNQIIVLSSRRVNANGIFVNANGNPIPANGAPLNDGFEIKLGRNEESFFVPPGQNIFVIKSYSFDNGQNWRDTRNNDHKIPDNEFQRAIGRRSMMLWISDQYIERSTGKPHPNANFANFPTVNSRPNAPRFVVNYVFQNRQWADPTLIPAWFGEWALTQSPVINALPERGLLIGTENNPRERSRDTEIRFGNFPASGGIPVEPLFNERSFNRRYFIKTAPKAELDGSFTPAGRVRRISVSSQLRPARYTISKNDSLRLRPNITAYRMMHNDGPLFAGVATNSTSVWQAGDYRTIWLWNIETARRPATALLRAKPTQEQGVGFFAAIGNVTVSGERYRPISSQTVTITLQGSSFTGIAAGDNVIDWFTNIPTGLTASVSAVNTTVLTVTISDTPQENKQENIFVTIPLGHLLDINTPVTIAVNPNARYNIGGIYATVADDNAVAITGTAGLPISNQTITVSLYNDSFTGLVAGTVCSGGICPTPGCGGFGICSSAGSNVTGWFTNMPSGLTAIVTELNSGNPATVIITITGTPATGSDAVIEITIPAANLSDSDISVPVVETPRAVYNIVSIRARIADVTISGALTHPISPPPQTVTVTLENDTFDINVLTVGDPVSSWFIPALPTDLTAEIAVLNPASLAISITGTPEAGSVAPIVIMIPNTALTLSSGSITTEANANAVYNIGGIEATVVDDVTVSGVVSDEITAQAVTINLHHDTFMGLSVGDNVAAWFTNLPPSLTAVIATITPTTAVVTIAGTPDDPLGALQAPMAIVIPNTALTLSGAPLAVTPNAEAEAKYDILLIGSAVISNVSINGAAGQAVTPAIFTITLTNDTFKDLNVGNDISDWFRHGNIVAPADILPVGLTATATTVTPTAVTITVTGTAMELSVGEIAAVIPAANITGNRIIETTPNPSAVYNIDRGIMVRGAPFVLRGSVGTNIASGNTALFILDIFGGDIFTGFTLPQNISSWFVGLPAGLTATVVEANSMTIVIGFTGIPTVPSNAAITINVPGPNLTSGIGGTYTLDAVYNIS
jgi:hypothetical protein